MIRDAADTCPDYTKYAMTNAELTDYLTPKTSAATDIITGATVDSTVGNAITKIGNMVFMNVGFEGVTAVSTNVLFKIPSDYRPPKNVVVSTMTNHTVNIKSDGDVLARENINNEKIFVSASWVTL